MAEAAGSGIELRLLRKATKSSAPSSYDSASPTTKRTLRSPLSTARPRAAAIAAALESMPTNSLPGKACAIMSVLPPYPQPTSPNARSRKEFRPISRSVMAYSPVHEAVTKSTYW